jgi:ABC-type polysaccharide/polyol phosphate transport system ATPase subunit
MSDSPAIVVEGLGKMYRVARAGSIPTDGDSRGGRVGRWLRRLRNREFGDRELWALRDVSFSVDPGTVVGVIGPNGAGKSTLLKILARVTMPSTGRVMGRGRVVSLLELGAGFDDDSSARENIYMNAAFYGIPRDVVDRRFADIIEFAELADFVDTELSVFSSGMYLRLAFSVAINMEPDILLADEILAVGDISFQKRCLERVSEAGKQGLTVFFVSHDMEAIARICDRVIWLAGGSVVQDGPPTVVVPEYQGSAWESGERQEGATGAARYGEVVEVRLLNADGREVAAVSRFEDALIRVRFRTGTAKMRARVGIDLHTRGIHVLRSTQHEIAQVNPVRVYETLVRVPARFLAETMYTVSINLILNRVSGEEMIVQESKALSFLVYGDTIKPGDAVAAAATRTTAGLIAPELAWEKVEEYENV